MIFHKTYSCLVHLRLGKRSFSLIVLSTLGSLLPIGCGIGAYQASIDTNPPDIFSEPVNQSVPMGLSGTFSAEVSGYPVNYQWYENGIAIAGANTPTYITPPTAYTDTGSIFTLTAWNSYGTVTSTPAVLTVTARAPKQGDLRFQEVDAASTVPNDGGGISTEIAGWDGWNFGNSTGTPLSIGPGCPAQGSTKEECLWFISSLPLPDYETGLNVYYQGFPYSDFATDLTTLAASNQVVTSWDIEPLSSTFAASWIQTTSGPAFDMRMETVSPTQLQAAASQDGLNSRVITAVSWVSGQISYLSYGWQGDTTTVYDVQTATATISTVTSVAQQLANEGYIITAMGGTIADGLLLVGTRVHGDSMPRPMLIAQPPTTNPVILNEGGYAVVGRVLDLDPTTDNLLADYWIGER